MARIKPPGEAAGPVSPPARTRSWSVIGNPFQKAGRADETTRPESPPRGVLVSCEGGELALGDVEQAGELRIVHVRLGHRADAGVDVLGQPRPMRGGIAVPDAGIAHHVWILDDQAVDRAVLQV